MRLHGMAITITSMSAPHPPKQSTGPLLSKACCPLEPAHAFCSASFQVARTRPPTGKQASHIMQLTPFVAQASRW